MEVPVLVPNLAATVRWVMEPHRDSKVKMGMGEEGMDSTSRPN